MNNQQISLMLQALSVFARIEAMKAENESRLYSCELRAYSERDFFEAESEIIELSKIALEMK